MLDDKFDDNLHGYLHDTSPYVIDPVKVITLAAVAGTLLVGGAYMAGHLGRRPATDAKKNPSDPAPK